MADENRLHRFAILERDRDLDPPIQACVRRCGAIALNLVERREGHGGIHHLVHFAPDLPFSRRNGCRIDAQVKERGADPRSPDRFERAIEGGSSRPLAPAHQRAVEKHQIRHGDRSKVRLHDLTEITASLPYSFTGGNLEEAKGGGWDLP